MKTSSILATAAAAICLTVASASAGTTPNAPKAQSAKTSVVAKSGGAKKAHKGRKHRHGGKKGAAKATTPAAK
ncbi:MAG TPA: hypothetical protein VHI13_00480 [Candidatus Kapabacteria bacterium]|nr:hypothetical protein [Candidatus Kapabacteria bacterium]